MNKINQSIHKQKSALIIIIIIMITTLTHLPTGNVVKVAVIHLQHKQANLTNQNEKKKPFFSQNLAGKAKKLFCEKPV